MRFLEMIVFVITKRNAIQNIISMIDDKWSKKKQALIELLKKKNCQSLRA